MRQREKGSKSCDDIAREFEETTKRFKAVTKVWDRVIQHLEDTRKVFVK